MPSNFAERFSWLNAPHFEPEPAIGVWPWTKPLPEFESIYAGHQLNGKNFACFRMEGVSCYSLYLTIGGKACFRCEGRVFEATRNSLVLIEPHTPHDYFKDPKSPVWECIWIHFFSRPDWVNYLAFPFVIPGHRQLLVPKTRQGSLFVDSLRSVVRLSASPLVRDGFRAMHCLEEAVLHLQEFHPEADNRALDPRIERILASISNNLQKSVSLETLAKQANLSVSRMAHLFREQVGESPHAFMDRHKIQLAKRYLRNSTSNITEIAESCGYGSVYAFSKRFKKITGVSPAQYRHLNSATLYSWSSSEPNP